MYRHKKILIITIAVFAFFAVLALMVNASLKKHERRNTVLDQQGEGAARETIVGFGSKLKNVPLLSDEKTLKQSINKEYKPYVTNELLNFWLDNLDSAPGRATSSPWPEKIEILEFDKTNEGYISEGYIVLMTSVDIERGSGNSGTIPVKLKLVDEGSGWKISKYEELPKENYQQTPGDVLQKKVRLKINEQADAFDLKIMPTEVIEDSRCPINARCIWAGTLKIVARLIINGQSGSANSIFTLDEPLKWNDYTITLIGSDPDKIDKEDQIYAYIFLIEKK